MNYNQYKYYHFTQYSLFLVFGFILGFICLNPKISSLLPILPIIQNSCQQYNGIYCYSINTIYCLSLSLTIFYLINFLILLKFKKYYLNYYLARWLFFLLILASTVWYPSIIIHLFAWLAVFLASLFILMVVIIWIDFAIQWQQQQLHYLQPHRSKFNQLCIIGFDIISVVFIIANFILNIVGLVLFNCPTGITVIGINLSIGLFYYILPFKFKNVTMFPVSMIVLYNTYVVFQSLNYGIALTSDCYYFTNKHITANNVVTITNTNDLLITSNSINFITIFDTFVTLVSLIWTCFSLSNNHWFCLVQTDYQQNVFNRTRLLTNNNIYDQESFELNDIEANNIVANNRQYGSIENEIILEILSPIFFKQFRLFFIIMIIASSYLLMTLSSWQIYGHTLELTIDSGITSMIVKLLSVTVCYLLYGYQIYSS